MENLRFPPETYTVGWVCALPLELQAARAMLDEEHGTPSQSSHETNIYCLPRIGQHNVVVVSLPAGRYGTNAAAACVAQLMEKFRSIKFGFLVGIAGGAPRDEADVRLGDIVISQPQGQYGGVVQYDLGKIEAGGKSHRTGYLIPPPTVLLNALAKFRALERDRSSYLNTLLSSAEDIKPTDPDILYESTYDHVQGGTCQNCDPGKIKERKARSGTRVHCGSIASGNQVVKDGITRDSLSRELDGVLCFEMEAAGVVNTLPCLVIRGICDYCDSHKNKQWQKYAALVAALCAKSFFDIVPAALATKFDVDAEARTRFEATFVTGPLVDRARLITAKGERVDGTCRWICEEELYKSWMNHGESPFLWLCGGPGKGKTMLAIFLTEEFERRQCAGQEGDLVFFFCGHESEKRNTAIMVLRGLIYQIVQQQPNLFRHAQMSFDTERKAKFTLSSVEAMCTIFQQMVQDPEKGPMFCILDGLDECDGGSVTFLATKLSRLFKQDNNKPPEFRMVVISREIHALKGCPKIQLDPDFDEQVGNDIKQFVQHRVRDLYRIDGFTDELAKHVEEVLIQRSEGTFLWVGFVMSELLQKTTSTELVVTLGTIPKGLPNIYDRIFLQIREAQRPVCASILLWVALAFRPLTTHEMAYVIDSQPLPGANAEQAILDQLALCKPLVRVQDGRVGLIHESAREYLVRDKRDDNPVLEAFRVNHERGHFMIVQTCLEIIEKVGGHREMVDSQKVPFLDYAIFNWTAHARSAGTQEDAIFDMSRPMSRKDSAVAKFWFTAYHAFDEARPLEVYPLLHMASWAGLTAWVRKLLLRKRWKLRIRRYVNKNASHGDTPLHLSVWWSHVSTAQLLLENGAEPNVLDGDGFAPIYQAAYNENHVMVRLLLEYGANINIDSDGHTPLSLACLIANRRTAEFLIAHGADVNPTGNFKAPLQIATEMEYDEIVELLINHGAMVDIADPALGLSPLMRAVEQENSLIVKMLLSRGADPNFHHKKHSKWTAMVRAILGNAQSTLPLLIEYGGNINCLDKNGFTPLWWAIFQGNTFAVTILLDHGADVSIKPDWCDYREMAVEKGHDEIVRILDEHERQKKNGEHDS